jgi:hypothetical protein
MMRGHDRLPLKRCNDARRDTRDPAREDPGAA